MNLEVRKDPKIALCRKCHGIGLIQQKEADGVIILERCPQCEGSGRVIVSAVIDYDIRPYKQKER